MKSNKISKKVPYIPFWLVWLFPHKRKGLAISTKSPLKYYLFQNKISLAAINWFFQGMRSMGAADLIGKIILEIIFIKIFMILLQGSNITQFIMSFTAAHTINWLINSHFWDVGRFLGITRTSPDRFFPYIRIIMNRTVRSDSIHAVIVIGGVSRNAGFRETSDVDMIFISERGFTNAVKAVIITVRERVMAFVCKFPLHLELYDSITEVKHGSDEVPIILKDIKHIVRDSYSKVGKQTAVLDDYEI